LSCSKYAEASLPVAREKLPQEMRAAEKAPPGPPGSLPEEAPSGSWGIIGEYPRACAQGFPESSAACGRVAALRSRLSQQWPWMALLA